MPSSSPSFRSRSANASAHDRTLSLLYRELLPARDSSANGLGTALFVSHLQALRSALDSPGASMQPEITFDDGHLSDLEIATPLLREHNFVATSFIPVGQVGRGAHRMGWAEVRELHAAGQCIGSKGWNSVFLTRCTESELEHELYASRAALEHALGSRVNTLALPGGKFNARVLQACIEAGYKKVYASSSIEAPPTSAVLTGRLEIQGTMQAADLLRLFSSGASTGWKVQRSLSTDSRIGHFFRDNALVKALSTLRCLPRRIVNHGT